MSVYLQYLLNKVSTVVPVVNAAPVGGSGSGSGSNSDQPEINITPPSGGFGDREIGDLIGLAINWAVAIGAVATLAYIILGGFQYVTAGDDAEQAEGGRSHITNGVIGLIIIASAFAIFKLLVNILNLDTIFPGL